MIWRRRNDLTQPQAADYFSLTLWEFRLAEAGRIPSPKVALGKLAPHEAAVILRRREGLSRKRFAKMLGVSPWWLTQMERGQQPADRLVEYWGSAK